MDEVRRGVHGRIAAVAYPQPVGRGKNIKCFRGRIVKGRGIGEVARYEGISVPGTVPVAGNGTARGGGNERKDNEAVFHIIILYDHEHALEESLDHKGIIFTFKIASIQVPIVYLFQWVLWVVRTF